MGSSNANSCNQYTCTAKGRLSVSTDPCMYSTMETAMYGQIQEQQRRQWVAQSIEHTRCTHLIAPTPRADVRSNKLRQELRWITTATSIEEAIRRIEHTFDDYSEKGLLASWDLHHAQLYRAAKRSMATDIGAPEDSQPIALCPKCDWYFADPQILYFHCAQHRNTHLAVELAEGDNEWLTRCWATSYAFEHLWSLNASGVPPSLYFGMADEKQIMSKENEPYYPVACQKCEQWLADPGCVKMHKMSILGCTFSHEPPTIQLGKWDVAGAAKQIDEIRPIAAWRNCFLRFWLNRYLKTIKYLQLCQLIHKGLPIWATQEIATYLLCPKQVSSLASVRNAQRTCALLRRRKTLISTLCARIPYLRFW